MSVSVVPPETGVTIIVSKSIVTRKPTLVGKPIFEATEIVVAVLVSWERIAVSIVAVTLKFVSVVGVVPIVIVWFPPAPGM